eukprot:c54738_g1_i1 orf=41-376(+)
MIRKMIRLYSQVIFSAVQQNCWLFYHQFSVNPAIQHLTRDIRSSISELHHRRAVQRVVAPSSIHDNAVGFSPYADLHSTAVAMRWENLYLHHKQLAGSIGRLLADAPGLNP